MIGPQTPHAQELHATKYRGEGETFDDYCIRYSRTVSESENHFRKLLSGLREQRILPAGRQQLAVGRAYDITAMNCYVGGSIPDDSAGIMEELKRSMLTLRTGGGCGWDFSTLRPYGDPIRGLGLKAYATGPVSFMGCWDAMCRTVLSAGHRRGAMMGVLRVDHPDIMRFINAKADQTSLTAFNISVAVTDDFMEALEDDGLYNLSFDGTRYETARAVDVWSRIMERNWDWGEPGILFIDRINRLNPLSYCEQMYATNPCGEQPLPANGACLLGSLNLVKYLIPTWGQKDLKEVKYTLDFDQIREDVDTAVRAYDNVLDRTHYPMEEQKLESMQKRRMGLGVTGVANALETMGFSYGTDSYIALQDEILDEIRLQAIQTSCELASDKGPFPAFDADSYLNTYYGKSLPEGIRDEIKEKGLRNGTLTSIAPTGTISMCADNVSAGIEPPYALRSRRLIHMPQGQVEVDVEDYALREYKVEGRTAHQVGAADHVRVLCAAQRFVDSAVSKTCNVDGQTPEGKGVVSFDDFKDLYTQAWKGGAKGCTTFNINGKRFGIMREVEDEQAVACEINIETGVKSCEA